VVTFNGGRGSGAAANAAIATGGKLTGVTITNGGSGYTSTPTVSFSGGGGSSASGTATIGDPDDNTGEPEMISNKSRRNIYRYNTLLNNYGQLCLRQGDYCTIQGNYFLAGGAYDGNGNIVLTETRNNQMGGVRAFGFGHVIANNYFYKLNGDGIRSALILGSGDTETGTFAKLNNGANGASYETANYTHVIGNSFIDCKVLTLDNQNGYTNPVYGTQFLNNLIHYSSNISGWGIIVDVTTSNYGALSDHGGRAEGNHIYSSNSSQRGDAGSLLGTSSNVVSGSQNSLISEFYDVMPVPAATSPVVGKAQGLPVVNDTSDSVSSTGTAYDLAGTVATYGALDMRGLTRPETGRDIGSYEVGVTGAGNRPLRRAEVGVVAATYPNAIQVQSVTQGVAFSQTLTTSFSTGTLTWSATGLPDGVSLSTGGILSGNAVVAGKYSVAIRVTDSVGSFADTLVPVSVLIPIPVITSPTTAVGETGKLFNYQITASNSPTSFGAINLPSWLNVNTNSGLITGTPTNALTNTFTIFATHSGGTGTAALTLSISNGLNFSGFFGAGTDPAQAGTDGLTYLMKYSLGGTNTNDNVSLPTVALNGNTLTMTAVVRTNDTNVQIVGQWITDLTGTWSDIPTNPNGTASTNTNNVPTGCQRRDFSVEKDTNSRLFLRLKASQ
jgi:hypothetical protein